MTGTQPPEQAQITGIDPPLRWISDFRFSPRNVRGVLLYNHTPITHTTRIKVFCIRYIFYTNYAYRVNYGFQVRFNY